MFQDSWIILYYVYIFTMRHHKFFNSLKGKFFQHYKNLSTLFPFNMWKQKLADYYFLENI